MFTLRFIKDLDNRTFKFVISAKKYSIFSEIDSSKTTINVFDVNGSSEEYVVCQPGSDDEYNCCYIENSSGKTIDCIRY